MKLLKTILLVIFFAFFNACSNKQTQENKNVTETNQIKPASEIFGNPNYLAMAYGGYRETTREQVPTVEDIKEDLKILAALNVKLVRTYNTQQFAHALNLLKAIKELKAENPNFEMYVMLGAWIDCEGAWTATPNHENESVENNTKEINAAVEMANQFPDIVKAIAVGNEAMVHWAASYFVIPKHNLKWVNHLQNLKSEGKLPKGLWVTSSDNFASWGGGDSSYHNQDLNKLIEAVDFISLHTYPFHDSHYQPNYWLAPADEDSLSEIEKAESAVKRAAQYAQSQYKSAKGYMENLGLNKPIHIGETGWASVCGFLYGPNGSMAADEYKAKLYYDYTREWTNAQNLTCFFFEAFDEQWKDPTSNAGSENHFGLIQLDGKAKYALWDMVDQGTFEGLTRNGFPITKTYDGNLDSLKKDVFAPPAAAMNTVK